MILLFGLILLFASDDAREYSAIKQRSVVESRFPILRWHYQHGDQVRFRDTVLDKANIDKELNYRLDKIIKQRLESHDGNLAIVQSIELRERLMIRSATESQRRQLSDGFVKEAELVLDKFRAAEDAAEKEMVDQLVELLPHDQFERFAAVVVKSGSIDNALAARWLKLSQQQQTDIKDACKKRDDIAALPEMFPSSPEYLRAKYKVYAGLTLEQFTKAKVLVPEVANFSFSGRLNFIKARQNPREQIELECLGDLYRQGAANE